MITKYMKTILSVGPLGMWRENHPSTSNYTTVAEPRLGVWGAYDTNSEEICRDKLAFICWNWLSFLKNGRLTMTSSFSPKIHTKCQVLVKACECSWQLYFRLFHFILYTWYFTENHNEIMFTIYLEWKS